VNAKADKGFTPLGEAEFNAALNGEDEVVDILVAAGAKD